MFRKILHRRNQVCFDKFFFSNVWYDVHNDRWDIEETMCFLFVFFCVRTMLNRWESYNYNLIPSPLWHNAHAKKCTRIVSFMSQRLTCFEIPIHSFRVCLLLQSSDNISKTKTLVSNIHETCLILNKLQYYVDGISSVFCFVLFDINKTTGLFFAIIALPY